MSEECTHDCSSCSQKDCGSRDLRAKANDGSNIKKVIAVVSGKGGVGKSSVTSLLAAAMNKKGCKVGILDADITGPSIPTAFGVSERPLSDGTSLFPSASASGIKVMSLNLLLENPEEPVLWRGPVIAGAVKQFWTDVAWGDVDFLFVDMPPGTGDVALTVFQSLPVDGAVIVSTPQGLVSLIVEKAVKMCEAMNIPVIGLVDNMSYIKCPRCGEVIRPFGESHSRFLASKYGINAFAELPMDSAFAKATDEGKMSEAETSELNPILNELLKYIF